MPNSAFVGHTGSGPPGVVGSPAQMAAHTNVVDAATINGAPNSLGETDPWRVTISAIRV
jgi:hypothetical protein